MSPQERPCANPACRDDISDMRAGAEVCRRKACRSWRDRRAAPDTRSLNPTCTRGCPAVGWCARHGRYNLLPRRADEETSGGGGKRARIDRGIRTRIVGDPPPQYAPRGEDFIVRDRNGKPVRELYAERPLPGQAAEWLDAVAPWRLRPVELERASIHMKPLRGVRQSERAGIPRDRWPEHDAGVVDGTPGPLDSDIYELTIGEGPPLPAAWGARPLRVKRMEFKDFTTIEERRGDEQPERKGVEYPEQTVEPRRPNIEAMRSAAMRSAVQAGLDVRLTRAEDGGIVVSIESKADDADIVELPAEPDDLAEAA